MAVRRSVASAALLGAFVGCSLAAGVTAVYWVWMLGWWAIILSRGPESGRMLKMLPSEASMPVVRGMFAVVATTFLALGIWLVVRLFVSFRRQRDPFITNISLGR